MKNGDILRIKQTTQVQAACPGSVENRNHGDGFVTLVITNEQSRNECSNLYELKTVVYYIPSLQTPRTK